MKSKNWLILSFVSLVLTVLSFIGASSTENWQITFAVLAMTFLIGTLLLLLAYIAYKGEEDRRNASRQDSS